MFGFGSWISDKDIILNILTYVFINLASLLFIKYFIINTIIDYQKAQNKLLSQIIRNTNNK